jgi:hypothetical protein
MKPAESREPIAEVTHGRRCCTSKALFLAASDLDDPAERALFLEHEGGGGAKRHAGGIKPAGTTDFSEPPR